MKAKFANGLPLIQSRKDAFFNRIFTIYNMTNYPHTPA